MPSVPALSPTPNRKENTGVKCLKKQKKTTTTEKSIASQIESNQIEIVRFNCSVVSFPFCTKICDWIK